MPKSTKSSAKRTKSLPPLEDDLSSTQEELSSSEQEADPEVSFNPHIPLQPSTSHMRQPQPAPNMYMPYIQDPCMEWTVNDGLYHWFLKWHLKCENILECELAELLEWWQCKKVIAWSRDCRMDQYVSWNLQSDELNLETIWGIYEEYCKPQSNKIQARFDLLTSFRQGNHTIDEWYNAVQAQVNLAKYPLETAKILHRDIFWFFLKDEDFVSRTISDGSIDLDKFPACRVWQLAKKLKSSKATTRHIKQVSGEPQATQINLLRHQRTKIPPKHYKKKRSQTKPRPNNNRPHRQEHYQNQVPCKKKGDQRPVPTCNPNRGSKCGDTTHCKGFSCPAKKYQCKACHKFGHFTSQYFQKKKQLHNKHRWLKVHQIQADEIYDSANNYPSEDSPSKDSFCLQVKIKWKQDGAKKVPRPTHLITNIACQLKQHHMTNQYLRARIDTCADMNIMPVSVYRLLYSDYDLKKLTPSQLKIGTYTTDTVKILGLCTIYLLHPDIKKLKEAVFYIASHDGSVPLSCKTSITFGIIQPRLRLDYLPPRASLITSTADHPRKTRVQLQIQKQEIIVQTTNQPEDAQLTITMQIANKLITSRDQIMHEYPDDFEGISKFPGPPYHIQVDPSVSPKQAPCRPIPIHLKEAFQKEINKMLQAGVLVQLEYLSQSQKLPLGSIVLS